MNRLVLMLLVILMSVSGALAHPGHVHLPGIPHPPEPATGATGPVVIIGVALLVGAVYVLKRHARR